MASFVRQLGTELTTGLGQVASGISQVGKDFVALVGGADDPKGPQVLYETNVVALSSLAIVHGISPLWNHSAAMLIEDDSSPPAPSIDYRDPDVVEFLRTLRSTHTDLAKLHPTLKGDWKLSTVFITLLAARCLLMERTGDSWGDYDQVLRESDLLTHSTAPNTRDYRRPTQDGQLQRKVQWEVDRLTVTRDVKTAHCNVLFNHRRCRLLQILITATVQYRYFAYNRQLQYMFGRWAQEAEFIPDEDKLIRLVITECSPTTYWVKWIRFVTSVSSPPWERVDRVLDNWTPHVEDENSRYLVKHSPAPLHRAAYLLIAGLESTFLSRNADEDVLTGPLCMVVAAIEQVVDDLDIDPIGNSYRLAGLSAWMLGWFRKLHTTSATSDLTSRLFSTLKRIYTNPRPVGNPVEWVMEEVRHTIPCMLFPDPSLRIQFYVHLKVSGRVAQRRTLYLLVNPMAKGLKRFQDVDVGSVSFCHEPTQLKTPQDPSLVLGQDIDSDKDVVGLKANLLANLVDGFNSISDEEKATVWDKPKQCLAYWWNELEKILEDIHVDDTDMGEVWHKTQSAVMKLIRESILPDTRFERDGEETDLEEDQEASLATAPARQPMYADRWTEWRYEETMRDQRTHMRRHPAPRMPVRDITVESSGVDALDDRASTGSQNHMPETTWTATLRQLFEAEQQGTPPDCTHPESVMLPQAIYNKVRLDIGLVGGTMSFHRFVMAYVALSEELGVEFYEADIRLYPLPFGSSNVVSKYLAQFDPWYYTTIWCPLVVEEPPQVAETTPGAATRADGVTRRRPSHDVNAEVQQGLALVDDLTRRSQLTSRYSHEGGPCEGVIDPAPEAQLLRLTLESYVSNAIFGKPIRVWVADCYSPTRSIVSIPFAQRLELGTAVLMTEYSKRLAQQEGLRAESDGYEWEPGTGKGPRNWSYNRESQATSVRCVGWQGTFGLKFKESFEGSVDDVVVSNLPQHGDHLCPDPELPTLGVWINYVERKTRKPPDMGHHYLMEFTEVSDRITLDALDKEVRCCIDGDVFGPFSRIEIRPCMKPGFTPTTSPPPPGSPTRLGRDMSRSSLASFSVTHEEACRDVMANQLAVNVMAFSDCWADL